MNIVRKKHPLSYTDSLASILHQEVESYNKLVTVIQASSQLVNQAVQGIFQPVYSFIH